MSISDKKLKNPATKFIDFKSNEKQFVYYDKAAGKNVAVKLPFLFVVLDITSSIVGFNKDSGSGIYSNEIHSVNEEVLHVRTFKGNECVIGTWKDKKGEIDSLGGRYCNNIYALHIDKVDNKFSYDLVCLRLSGAALGTWFDFKYVDDLHIVGIQNEFKEETNGAVKYNVPVFKTYKMDPDILKEAERIDIEILKPYFAAKGKVFSEVPDVEESVVVVPSSAPPAPVNEVPAPIETPEIPEPNDDLPF